MAQSRHRHKHGHQHAHHHAQHHSATAGPRQQSPGKAVRIMMIFLGVLGLFVAYVSAGPDLLWLTVGLVAGAVAGYFVGRSMARASQK